MPKITYEQEEEYRKLKAQNDAVDTLMARLTAWEAAMRIIVRHDLLKDLADEMRALEPVEAITAERDRYKAALEVIAGGSADKLQEIQAKNALDNIGPSSLGEMRTPISDAAGASAPAPRPRG